MLFAKLTGMHSRCLFVLACILAYVIPGFCQSSPEFAPNPFVVVGLELGQKLTYNDFVKKFGKPDKYSKSYLDETEIYYQERYEISNSWFECNEEIFTQFGIGDAKYSVYSNYIEGGIRVGDKLSKYDNCVLGKPEFYRKEDDGSDTYRFPWKTDDSLFLRVNDGVIVYIKFFSPM